MSVLSYSKKTMVQVFTRFAHEARSLHRFRPAGITRARLWRTLLRATSLLLFIGCGPGQGTPPARPRPVLSHHEDTEAFQGDDLPVEGAGGGAAAPDATPASPSSSVPDAPGLSLDGCGPEASARMAAGEFEEAEQVLRSIVHGWGAHEPYEPRGEAEAAQCKLLLAQALLAQKKTASAALYLMLAADELPGVDLQNVLAGIPKATRAMVRTAVENVERSWRGESYPEPFFPSLEALCEYESVFTDRETGDLGECKILRRASAAAIVQTSAYYMGVFADELVLAARSPEGWRTVIRPATATSGHGGAGAFDLLRFEVKQLIPGDEPGILLETRERYRDEGDPRDTRKAKNLTLCRQAATKWQCRLIPLSLYQEEDEEVTDWEIRWQLRKGKIAFKKSRGTLPPEIELLTRRAIDLKALISPCDCPPATGCTVLRTHKVGSAWARNRGLLLRKGRVACDPEALDCALKGTPAEGTLYELTEACGFWLDFYLATKKNIYIVSPQSIGVNGGPGWALVSIGDVDPGSFQPIGTGFAKDNTTLFDHGNAVPDVDPDDFQPLACDRECLGCTKERCLMECTKHPLDCPPFTWVAR